MTAHLGSPLLWILGTTLAWMALGVLGLARVRSVAYVGHLLFPLGALGSLVLAAAALIALTQPPQQIVLPLGLPDLPLHLRVDALSAFFLFLLGIASAGISTFAAGYFRAGEGTAPGVICLQYHVFLASMAFVFLADDAYAFMVAWETMALSSYFLVTTQHRLPEIRQAGFLYLLIAHVGALAILLAFGVLHGGTWQFTFDAMRAAELSPQWASAAFLLALFGFGAKAGLVPLHVWLPEAHPAAPSPVSALLSGVMLKTAIYGLLRVTFDLLDDTPWWWGLLAIAVGLFTALYGTIFAAVQTDMKRLLAYSSIENVGIICAAIGLAIAFDAYGMPALAVVALAAALLHCLNHACFKSLLFLATGAVLHATRERSLGRLGGLARQMPWVAALALVGTLAIAGLPPLNGFVSEWMLLQAFMLTPRIPQPFVNMLLPLGAAVLALTVALAAYVMVKFYGVIFLGQPREPSLANARDCGRFERAGLLWLAVACVLLGVLPLPMLRLIGVVTESLLGQPFANYADGLWMLAPISAQWATYAPAVFLLGVAVIFAATVLAVRAWYPRRARRARPWDCGYPLQTPRMQDTAEGFGQPIRHIFLPFFRMSRELPSPFDAAPRYRVQVEDRLWYALYLTLAAGVRKTAEVVGVLQQGRIASYLLYSFATLLVLLVIML